MNGQVENSLKNEIIRVFVASTPSEWLPMRVLEYSIRETTTLPVEVSAIYSYNKKLPVPKLIKNRARTPFSFQRFIIPELCGYRGKAIYLDADMQVFSDIKGLWDCNLAGHDLQTVQEGQNGRRNQYSVMLLNCETLRWNINEIVDWLDSGALDYETLMYEMRVAKSIGRDISSDWNSLEYFEHGVTRLLHYTDMNTQPWISTKNPLGNLWISCLIRSIHSGFIDRKELMREIKLGHVRPSLLVQVDEQIIDANAMSDAVKKMDMRFTPPYKNIIGMQYRINRMIREILVKIFNLITSSLGIALKTHETNRSK